jgi:hypothetical protein
MPAKPKIDHTFSEHTVVQLKSDFPQFSIKKGTVGVLIDRYSDAYEFLTVVDGNDVYFGVKPDQVQEISNNKNCLFCRPLPDESPLRVDVREERKREVITPPRLEYKSIEDFLSSLEIPPYKKSNKD